MGAAPPFPVLVDAIEHARRLSLLRARPGPLRTDLIDAVRSTFVKDEVATEGAPLLRELDAWLTGTAIGDVPPSAGSPPLVEAVRSEARRPARGRDGERRNRDLDIYRTRATAPPAASATPCWLLGAGSASAPAVRFPPRRRSRPASRDLVGLLVADGRSRLIERAAEADTLLRRWRWPSPMRWRRSAPRGAGATRPRRSICRGGLPRRDRRVGRCPPAVHRGRGDEDPDLGSVSRRLPIWWGRPQSRHAGDRQSAPITRLIETVWRRALLLLPTSRWRALTRRGRSSTR